MDSWPAQEARRAPHGMIASVNPLAGAAGLQVLRHGFALTARQARNNAEMAAIAAQFPDTTSVFFPNGRPPGAGFKLRQPGLARTPRTIQPEGAAAFYRGCIARAIVAASDQGGGLFSERDLPEHRTDVLPIQATYRGWTKLEQPPVSQGLIVLIALKILEGLDRSADPADRIHLTVEASGDMPWRSGSTQSVPRRPNQKPRATRTRRTSAWSTMHTTWSPIFTVNSPNRAGAGRAAGAHAELLDAAAGRDASGCRRYARLAFGESVMRSLRERGHTLRPIGDWAAGGAAQVIRIDGGMLTGVGDPRPGTSSVIGYRGAA
jgi:gamma-glutamyltranspeptidase